MPTQTVKNASDELNPSPEGLGLGESHCSSCRFWLSPGKAYGDCRRFPPQVVAYTESQTEGSMGDYRETVDTHTVSEFPETPADGWCGEYQTNDQDEGLRRDRGPQPQ